MAQRNTLLVGSMPFASEADAMRRALTAFGGSLLALPDGEIGEITPQFPNGSRSAWVMTAINLCAADTQNWEVVKQAVNDANGFPSDYPNVQRLKAKRPPSEMHKYLQFGYDHYFKQSYPIFKQLREEFNLPNLKFQVGVPTGLGIAFSMMNPIDALRYADAFNKRVAYEVNEILKIAPNDVVIQVEVPGEVAMSYQMPKLLVGLPVRSVLGLVRKIDPRAPFGIHLCLGDLNNIPLVHAPSLDKLVNFSNSLINQWPATHRLLYMHYPLAEAKNPPTLDKAFYQPLADVRLPAGVQFVAGFVHEKLTTQEHQDLLTTIEQVRGHNVAVACSCGMGRRPRPVAEQLMQSMREVMGQGWAAIDSADMPESLVSEQTVKQ